MSLRSLVENGLAGYLEETITDVPVYRGFSAQVKAAPCVIVSAVSAREEPYQSGNFELTTDVTIVSPMADGADAMDAIADRVRDALLVDDLDDSIQGTSQSLKVWGAGLELETEWRVDEDQLVTVHRLKLYCAEIGVAAQ